MNKNDMTETAFKMIGAIAKPKFDALQGLKDYKKDKDASKFLETLKNAEKELGAVGVMHLDIIQEEAQGKDLPYSMILMHAEDQYMTVQLLIEFMIANLDG